MALAGAPMARIASAGPSRNNLDSHGFDCRREMQG